MIPEQGKVMRKYKICIPWPIDVMEKMGRWTKRCLTRKR